MIDCWQIISRDEHAVALVLLKRMGHLDREADENEEKVGAGQARQEGVGGVLERLPTHAS